MIKVQTPADPVLASLLAQHPEVGLDKAKTQDRVLSFQKGDWARSLFWGDQTAQIRGLLELIDNNPVVCADTLCVPGPTATLASIALGPLLRADLIVEDPSLHLARHPEDPADILANLEILGLKTNVNIGVEQADFQGIFVLNAMVEIPVMDDYAAIDDLFDEAYARSFYVRRIDEDDWDTRLVANRPFAAYRLRLTPGEQATSLLTVQVMADQNGKAGASQVLHAFNVMNGFEECLGIPDDLSTLSITV